MTVQPPQHPTVQVRRKQLDSPEHLYGGGEGKAVHHLHAAADEAAALHVGVHVHGPVIMKLMAKVGCMSNPRQGLAV